MLIEELKSIVGPQGWTTDPHTLEPHLVEWRDRYRGNTPIMVSPRSTEEVSGIIRACQRDGTAIVPQGGNTGLCAGAIPSPDGTQVLLSLSRMNRIRSVSADDFSLVAEAGCTLLQVQEAAAAADRFFPLSLAAEGSCQIGGNLSTNAGGINVLRYGTARDLALGLEVVLADGSVLEGLKSLRKDTAGYDLKQLFIGSEGTLGVITAASLRLFPAIRSSATALLEVRSPADAVKLLGVLRQRLADHIQAFELIPNRAVEFVMRHIPGSRFPLSEDGAWFVLLEISESDLLPPLDEALLPELESGAIRDAVIAKNRDEAEQLWRLRHSISEAQKLEGASLKHDVSVPVADVAEFIATAEAAIVDALPGTRVVAFGHVGDGNIHFNLSQAREWQAEAFYRERERLADVVYEVVLRFNGSISAEHGIGVAKRDYLLTSKSDTEITLMRAIKQALDPHNLLNPGKVI